MTAASSSGEFDASAASTFIFMYQATRRYRGMVVIVTAAMALAGLVYAFFATPVYRASVTVIAAGDDESGGLSGLKALAGDLGDLGGLAAGLGGPGKSMNEALAVLRSRQLTDQFITKNNLLPELFYKDYDASEGKWKPPSAYARLRLWMSGAPRSANGQPSLWEAYRLFGKIRRVRIDKTDEVTVISIDWRDPQLATKWVNELVQMADDAMRARSIRDAQHIIDKLEEQERATNFSEIHRVIYAAAQQELRKTVMANVRESFALKVLDPAQPPELRAWPKRGLILALSIVGGIFLGCTAAIARRYLRLLRESMAASNAT